MDDIHSIKWLKARDLEQRAKGIIDAIDKCAVENTSGRRSCSVSRFLSYAETLLKKSKQIRQEG